MPAVTWHNDANQEAIMLSQIVLIWLGPAHGLPQSAITALRTADKGMRDTACGGHVPDLPGGKQYTPVHACPHERRLAFRCAVIHPMKSPSFSAVADELQQRQVALVCHTERRKGQGFSVHCIHDAAI